MRFSLFSLNSGYIWILFLSVDRKITAGLIEGIPVSGLLFPEAAGQRRRGIALGADQGMVGENERREYPR